MDGRTPVSKDGTSTGALTATTQDEICPRSGGPRTPEGKQRSRGNALRHGLTAQTLLREAFADGEIERFRDAFTAEWVPTTTTERVLVAEMARHAAALARAQQMEGAVLRQAARAALELALLDDIQDYGTDLLLAGSVTSEGIERLSRYRRSHEKGLFAALTRLREAKGRASSAPSEKLPMAHCFRTELECETYLRRRFESREFRCTGCGAGVGYWLSGRQRWQCGSCHRQFGIRTGTVLARSQLPLKAWFDGIRLLLEDPTISACALAAAIGIRREATARTISSKVRSALLSPQASRLLAGLDQVFGKRGRLQQAPLEAANLQNELPEDMTEARAVTPNAPAG
jgi:transposase-like protein